MNNWNQIKGKTDYPPEDVYVYAWVESKYYKGPAVRVWYKGDWFNELGHSTMDTDWSIENVTHWKHIIVPPGKVLPEL